MDAATQIDRKNGGGSAVDYPVVVAAAYHQQAII